ncbi:MAG: hydantoinase/oxoprolinase family protein [Anaerolineae bacterium]
MRIGIDIGGTFTDFVFVEDEEEPPRVWTYKVLSTPRNPSQAVVEGLKVIGHKGGKREIVHGSTVATNALLERKGAVTALLTTRGFRDVLEIGRQTRSHIYDLFVDRPEPLVPRSRRFEVRERINYEGKVLQELDMAELEPIICTLQQQGVESVAVCLLFSFLNPGHEERLAGRLREAGFLVSSSCQILPEYREYERCSTTTVNAYISPVLSRYLNHLGKEIEADDFRVMASNGGHLTLRRAAEEAVHAVLSGPAGGVVGARYLAQLAGRDCIITFDMGGTSTDVSLCHGKIMVTTESTVAGCPIGVPIIDIHTVGAGGGSIAYLDAGGALRVGPQSAGADPGPACYGQGDDPTVTDANLILGRLAPDFFLGGRMELDVERAWMVMERLAAETGLEVRAMAEGIVRVANSNMERALRVISVERGFDPRDFVLVTFGGAGGLHASELARSLAIPTVMVPRSAGTLSALGMLAADVIKDYSLTVMQPCQQTSCQGLEELFVPLTQRGLEEVVAEGVSPEEVVVDRLLDMRYVGQSYELTVPFTPQFVAAFHAAHQRTYGHSEEKAATEIVNIRVRALGKVDKPSPPLLPPGGDDPSQARIDERKVVLDRGERLVPFYWGEKLKAGNRMVGPAIVVEKDSTIFVGPDDLAQVDAYGNLIIQVAGTT